MQINKYIAQFLQITSMSVAIALSVDASAAELNQGSVAPPAGKGWQSLDAPAMAQPPISAAQSSALDSQIAADRKIGPPVILPNAPSRPVDQPAATPYVSPYGPAPSLVSVTDQSASGGIPTFVLRQGDHIQAKLDAWLKPQGWHLDWSATAGTPGRLRDLVSDEDYNLHPSSVGDLLQTLLAGYGFAADIDSSALIRRIVVRNDNNQTE